MFGGRWINRDPIVYKKPCRKYNDVLLYTFCKNSPISSTDIIGLDDPGCNLPGWLQVKGEKRDCIRKCCAMHDYCYYSRNGQNTDGLMPCTSSSWIPDLGQLFADKQNGIDALKSDPCMGCNRDVVDCYYSCFQTGIPNNSLSDSQFWFCPNGEHKGEFYETWGSIPKSCFADGYKPSHPPDEDPPPKSPECLPCRLPTVSEVVDQLNDFF